MGMLGPRMLLGAHRILQLPRLSISQTGTLAQLSFGAPLHQALMVLAIVGLLLGEGSWVLPPCLPTPLPSSRGMRTEIKDPFL